jgi:adenosylhomocysteine nucleosidase
MRTCFWCLAACLTFITFGASCTERCRWSDKQGRTAILGALDEETVLLHTQLTDERQWNIEGVEFFTGSLHGRKVVLGRTGIGKVNAAMTTILVIEHFKPDEVIFSGIAGAINPELRPGDIVIAEKVAEHDYGLVSDAGFETQATINPADNVHNPLFFIADQKLLDAAKSAAKHISVSQLRTTKGLVQPKITTGVVVTGDCFVASEAFGRRLRDRLGADAVEMEGAAVAQVCYQQKVPCLVIRSISDNADKTAAADLEKFLDTAAGNSAALVAEMVRLLGRTDSPVGASATDAERFQDD